MPKTIAPHDLYLMTWCLKPRPERMFIDSAAQSSKLIKTVRETMPRATATFKFEFEVMGAVRSQVIAWRGSDETDTFLMLLDATGKVMRYEFYARCARDCPTGVSQLRAAAASYVFYDPVEPGEYYYLHWKNVQRAWMERLFGFRFEADYLELSPGGRLRAGAKTFSEFPPTHGVMI